MFQHDELARLTRGTGVYGMIDYVYDAVGNVTSDAAIQNRAEFCHCPGSPRTLRVLAMTG